jgi:NADP-dependent aldehyde dehydrogenase
MTKGFRTFHAAQNTWGNTLYFPTPVSFLKDWEKTIAADQAFFRATSPLQRSELLNRICALIVAEKDAILQLYCKESGLSQARFEAEFSRLTSTISLFAKHIQTLAWQKESKVHSEAKTLLKKRVALGPVLVLGSSNFPLAYSTMGGDTVAALAAGCCVVLKAHPMHVGTSQAVANCVTRALEELSLPTGIFSHVLDNTYEWASTFAQHPQIKAIGFTGSIKGGRTLMDLAAARPDPIPVFAEMGSLNPVLVFKDLPQNDLRAAAQKLAASICTDAGQFCTKPGLLLVHESQLDAFQNNLLEALTKQVAVPMLHPSIHQKFEARKRQVFQVKGIEPHQSTTSLSGIVGRWGIAKCRITQLIEEPTLREEVFGPFAVLCSYGTTAELQSLLNVLDGQLTCSIFKSQDQTLDAEIEYLLYEKTGRIIINSVPTGVSVVEAMQHGGPYPASSDARFTAVGPDSLLRFTKEVTWQLHDSL